MKGGKVNRSEVLEQLIRVQMDEGCFRSLSRKTSETRPRGCGFIRGSITPRADKSSRGRHDPYLRPRVERREFLTHLALPNGGVDAAWTIPFDVRTQRWVRPAFSICKAYLIASARKPVAATGAWSSPTCSLDSPALAFVEKKGRVDARPFCKSHEVGVSARHSATRSSSPRIAEL